MWAVGRTAFNLNNCLPHPGSCPVHVAITQTAPMRRRLLRLLLPWADTEVDRPVMCIRVAIAQVGAVVGIPATGKTANAKEMHSFRLIDGQIAEHWVVMDQLGMVQQFGVIPLHGRGHTEIAPVSLRMVRKAAVSNRCIDRKENDGHIRCRIARIRSPPSLICVRTSRGAPLR